MSIVIAIGFEHWRGTGALATLADQLVFGWSRQNPGAEQN